MKLKAVKLTDSFLQGVWLSKPDTSSCGNEGLSGLFKAHEDSLKPQCSIADRIWSSSPMVPAHRSQAARLRLCFQIICFAIE